MNIDYQSLLHRAGINLDVRVIHTTKRFLSQQKYTSKNVLVITDDCLSDPVFFFFEKNNHSPTPLDSMFSIAANNPDTNFFVLHNCFNLPDDSPNLKLVYWAPEWVTNGRNDYRQIAPVNEKQASTATTWISLNGNRRIHRYITSMYLLGNDLERSGYLTLDPAEILEHESWHTWLSWWKYNDRNEIFSAESSFDILEKGFDKIKAGQGFFTRAYSSISAPANNSSNFTNHLSGLYSKSLVELVNSTIWYPDQSAILCEKYLHTVYGKNLPLIVGAKNTVSFIRSLGFDVFDDLIDHSYDAIDDPVTRLITALDSNKRLFSDFDHALKCWKAGESRMQNNVDRAKHIENTITDDMVETIKQRILPFIVSG